MKNRLKKIWFLIKTPIADFIDLDGVNYAAIIAFYTIFSLPGILIIVINIAGSVFGEEVVQGELAAQIEEAVGRGSALQIQNVIENAIQSDAPTFATIAGIAILIFSATTVFIAMQDSINYLWHIKPKPEKGYIKFAFNRILSFAMLVSLGFLLVVSLSVDILLVALNNYLQQLLVDVTVYLVTILGFIITLVVNALIFALIYKVLPDAKIRWKDAFIGALVTAFLFIIGKFLIGLYIGESDLDSTYGAAGALVIFLVWVYYSSNILLIGAQFTYHYTNKFGGGVELKEDAVEIVYRELENDSKKPKQH